MSSIAEVNNGQIVNNSSSVTSSISKAEKAQSEEAGGTLGKDAFLQLLVAQMKYQDPLEPTDNTEYVSQLATFSELEEMQNLVQSTDMQRASVLIGQYVSIADTDASGNTKHVEGYVDSVVYQGSKTYVSVNEVLYNFDSIEAVYDSDYIYAQKVAEAAANGTSDDSSSGNGSTGGDGEADGIENA